MSISEPTTSSLYPNKFKATLLDLPSEIMFEIAKHVSLDDDLCYLVRTCRFTFNLLNLELYKRSCRRDNFAILWGAKTGSIVTVKRALDMGADCNVKASGLIKLVREILLHRRSHSPTFNLIQVCHDMHGKTPLVLAAENGHDNVIQILLRDPRVFSSGPDAIQAAALNGHATSVELLLSRKVFHSDHCDQPNTALLHLAAGKGHEKAVSVILNRTNAKVGGTDGSGLTALHLAAKKGHRRTLKTLLEHEDTDVNVRDGRGNTSLHIALGEKHISTVKTLLGHSLTDVNIKDRHGLQAIHWITKMDLRPWPASSRKQLRFA